MMSLREAMTPFFISVRTTSAPVFFMREASSPTPMVSGICTFVGGLFGDLKVQLLHPVTLFLAALGAGGGLLLALLLAVLELLLAAAVGALPALLRAVRAGGQPVEALVILAEVYVAAAALSMTRFSGTCRG